MERLNKKIRLLFWFALGLSVGFPLGVLGIIFGAIHFIVPLLVLGIILTVAGFYAMPILWTRYGDRRCDRSLLFMIENEYLYTVRELAAQTGYEENDVRERIKRMIVSHILIGYIFKDDELIANTAIPQAKRSRRVKVCPQCGAPMTHDGEKFFCEYCKYTAE